MARIRSPNKNSLIAIKHFEKLGLEPISEVLEAMDYAKQMTIKGGNTNKDGASDQSTWCGLWLKGALELCKYKYPQLSAIALNVHDGEEKKPITSVDAINIIKSDPFFPKNIKDNEVVDAMNYEIDRPILPTSKPQQGS